MKTIFINMLTFGTLFSSVLSITSKNPVISVIFVISTFVNAAGYLILIGVNFVGISYIVIYVGAIAVLFLFIIMMLNIKLTEILETGSQYTKNFPLAVAIGSLFIYMLFTLLPFSVGGLDNSSLLSNLLEHLTTFNTLALNSASLNTLALSSLELFSADTTITSFTQIESLGQGLYTYGAIMLIIVSVILLLSMIAAIFISRN